MEKKWWYFLAVFLALLFLALNTNSIFTQRSLIDDPSYAPYTNRDGVFRNLCETALVNLDEVWDNCQDRQHPPDGLPWPSECVETCSEQPYCQFDEEGNIDPASCAEFANQCFTFCNDQNGEYCEFAYDDTFDSCTTGSICSSCLNSCTFNYCQGDSDVREACEAFGALCPVDLRCSPHDPAWGPDNNGLCRGLG